jgi:hypothetical protein
MIYAIVTGDTVVALTNNKNDATRFPDYEMRWANESERARFRELAARHERRLWLQDKIDSALHWVWRISFPMNRNV